MAKKKFSEFLAALGDPALPMDLKMRLNTEMLAHPEAHNELAALYKALTDTKSEAIFQQKTREVTELIASLQRGPKRRGYFVEACERKEGLPAEAVVRTEDGAELECVLADPALLETLQRGDGVMLDASCGVLLGRNRAAAETGEVAEFVCKVSPRTVKLRFRGDEAHVFMGSVTLMDQVLKGELAEGNDVMVNRRASFCLAALPPQEGKSGYRYLSRASVPDVVVGRDLGCPPAYIQDLAEHVRMIMCHLDVMSRYRLRQCLTRLLTGGSGTGKTFSIQAFWNMMYQIMSQITGVPVEKLPHRVMRLRLSEVLSKWLGESDKSIDRFFDEVERLSKELFVAPDGKTYLLPALVIVEECEGLARARGGDSESTYDRIQSTVLQRLDQSAQQLRECPAIFLFTTNTPQLVDAAFLRRAGGMTIHFRRPNRHSFRQILSKQIRGLPIRSNNGFKPEELQGHVVEQITDWLYAPNSAEQVLAELSFAGSTNPTLIRRRDVITPALVDRAVQEAAGSAARAECLGEAGGISIDALAQAIDRQIRSVVEQLDRNNACNHVDVPEGARVVGVRRLAASPVLPFDVIRHS